jgi:hypothetical protein
MRASVSYSVQVNIGGLGLALFAVFGGGRSVHDVLVGGSEWGPMAQLEPWLEHESSPFSGLLGGGTPWGTEVESINWE